MNSIISNFQMRSFGHLISDVNIGYGGKTTMLTSKWFMIPNVLKGGLPCIEYYYPTDDQMRRDVKLEEITTSPSKWNPT